MTDGNENPFAELVCEIADGTKWTLLRAEGWDDFIERLSMLIGNLEPRRRQALVLLLFALVDRQLTPEQAQEWIDDHDLDSDDGLTEMLTWLHEFRPRPDENLPYE